MIMTDAELERLAYDLRKIDVDNYKYALPLARALSTIRELKKENEELRSDIDFLNYARREGG